MWFSLLSWLEPFLRPQGQRSFFAPCHRSREEERDTMLGVLREQGRGYAPNLRVGRGQSASAS